MNLENTVAQGDPVRPQNPAGDSDDVPLWLSRSVVRIFFWVTTAIVGFVQAWFQRFAISQDGNNYLDVATAYLHRDFAHALNAYWSPMFSWFIAIIFRALSPSGLWETTLLHLLNFAGLLIALRCFEYFFEAFLTFLKQSRDLHEETEAMSEPVCRLLGYGLFFSTSLFVLTMEPSTPDVWVCVVAYLSMGILMRIARQPEKTAYFAMLGFVLGLGYLTKSFYFPLAFVFLIVVGLFVRPSRRHFARVFLALFVFALVSGPFIFEISKAKSRFTFGEAGRITYAEAVSPIAQAFFWQGENQTGTPKHPTRQILSAPRVFEFATPVGGSYPPAYDMSYWMDGARPHFNIRGQLKILRQSVGTLFIIFVIQIEFAAGLLILWFLRERRSECFSSLARLWPLWVPPAVACMAYSLILIEPRYFAPFLVFLWLAGFASVAKASPACSRRVVYAVVLGMLAVTGIKTTKYFFSDLLGITHQKNVYWEVAQNLHELGIQPGDKAAIIAATTPPHWARLAGVKVVAELPPGQDDIFWKADRETQDRVYAAFASTGSHVVVAKDPPADVARDGWRPLGDTTYYAYLLPRAP